jgi:YidC/Oxa1 family membrane protein insertase
MLSANPFSGAVSAASSMISFLSTALTPVGGAVVAIILITIAFRLALHPLNRAAVRGERARTRLAPQVAAIRKKHAKNVTKMGEELTALYRSERISPFTGMLPMLIQAPIFLVIYRAFTKSGGNASLFGVPLHARFISSAGSLGVHVLVFIAIFAALAAIALITSRRAKMLSKINIVASTAAAGAAAGTAEMVAKIGTLAPFFVLISGAVLPLAAVLYLLTTTAFSAGENALLRRGLPA